MPRFMTEEESAAIRAEKRMMAAWRARIANDVTACMDAEFLGRYTARCSYCGRYGALGSCLGCGAATSPAAVQPEANHEHEWQERTCYGDTAQRWVCWCGAERAEHYRLPARQPDRVQR